MTIMIIEGPDLSGKTFAVEKLGKLFNSGFTIKNNFKPKSDLETKKIYGQYWKIIHLVYDYVYSKDIIILDRFFPSQAVYSYLREEDHMLPEFYPEILALDIYASVNNFVYVYINTPLELLKTRYKERGDEHIKIADLVKLKERYDYFYNITQMKKVAIDTTKLDWEKDFQTEVQNEY